MSPEQLDTAGAATIHPKLGQYSIPARNCHLANYLIVGYFHASSTGTLMQNSATLFRLLNEFILLLLGGLLILLAVSGSVGPQGGPTGYVFLGIILIYWGVRALIRKGPKKGDPLQARVRAGSLALVGLLILGIPLFPVRHAQLLLEIAGGVLVIRGFLGSILIFGRP